MSSCSSDEVINNLLGKRKPRYPGPEASNGEIKEFTKDQYGDWQSDRKYSERQKEQLEDYQRYRATQSND